MKILLIEDDIQSSFVVEKFLRQYDVEVFTAKDAEQAMHIAQTMRPAIVISDWNIFDIHSGIEISKAITVLNPDTSVIIISGYPKEEIRKLTVHAQLKTLAILEKPIVLEELFHAIQRYPMNASMSE